MRSKAYDRTGRLFLDKLDRLVSGVALIIEWACNIFLRASGHPHGNPPLRYRLAHFTLVKIIEWVWRLWA